MSASVPRVSIGVPVYNGEQFLEDVLDAILGQTFGDLDVVICDNASTDRTEAICRAYAARDRRIIYHRNQVNIGVTRNFNLAFRRSRGELFKWWAADDLCHPTFVARCVEALDGQPAAVLAYSRATNVDEMGRIIGSYDRYLTTPGASPSPEERFRRLLAEFLATDGLSVIVYQFGLLRRRALARTRLFGHYIGADLRLISELILAGPFVEIPEELLAIRAHEGSSSFGEATSNSEAMHAFINPGSAVSSGRPTGSGNARAAGPGLTDRIGVIHSRTRRFPAFVEAILRSPLDPCTKLTLAAETTGTLAAYLWRVYVLYYIR